ncbi:hypothetical protein HRR83_000804 [Exophiala dermatitidis]|uniref:Uncharacterized protein n=1 Tax=Exophiala dermatitidis TaxID=5970 RepID=A0AAN6F5V7_EXODE|nr:hypothetical protein HRR74_000808 [Exophiala dermatitidis]KAJ4528686.1 hypothetical protein HRR73_001309 [Exophiala dermatitidis]KAJ4530067.1 hypothetical protein HRR76_009305 [Exophiala dermatitidis]KAJ4558829.1 hypothetical protein HRR77_000806 [Exophiala dermatitidis]KAJ4581144.1 hypothetical protein HRR79_000191 [Exophiala dermatitidis]
MTSVFGLPPPRATQYPTSIEGYMRTNATLHFNSPLAVAFEFTVSKQAGAGRSCTATIDSHLSFSRSNSTVNIKCLFAWAACVCQLQWSTLLAFVYRNQHHPLLTLLLAA